MIAVSAAQLAPRHRPRRCACRGTGHDPATGTTAWAVTTTPASTTTVPHDGTGGVAEFTYDYLLPGYVPGSNNGAGNGSGVPTQTWRFSSTATIAGQITLPWRLHGLHAWAGVTVDLRAYIKRGATDVQNTDLLLPGQEGPVSCCTTPSNGFDYSGTTNLTLQVGDEFGFTVSGGNGDSNSFLQGDLQVGLERRPKRQLRGSGRRPLWPAGVPVPRPKSATDRLDRTQRFCGPDPARRLERGRRQSVDRSRWLRGREPSPDPGDGTGAAVPGHVQVLLEPR